MSGLPTNRSATPAPGASRATRWRPYGPITGLRQWLACDGVQPSAATIWVIAYAALFLIRPWEVMVTELEVLRLETVGVLLLAARVALGADTRLDGRALAPVLFFIAAMLFTSFTSLDPGLSYDAVEQVVRIAIFAGCAIAALRTPADIRAFCLGWIAIMFAYEAKALWEYFVHGRGAMRMGIWRLIGIEDSHGDPNTFSGKAAILMPLAIFLSMNARSRRERNFLWLTIATGGLIIVLSGSRGGMLTAAFLVVLYALLSRKRVQAIAVGVALGILALLFLPDATLERYRTLIEPELNASATESMQGRWNGLRKGIDLFAMRPLVGVGPGVFPVTSEYVGRLPYEDVGMNPHNLLGQLVGETGLVGVFGFGIFVLFLCAAVAELRRIPPEESPQARFMAGLGPACGLMLALMAFQGIGAHNLRSYNWLWVGAILCSAVSVARQTGLSVPRAVARRNRRSGSSSSNPRSSAVSVASHQKPV